MGNSRSNWKKKDKRKEIKYVGSDLVAKGKKLSSDKSSSFRKLKEIMSLKSECFFNIYKFKDLTFIFLSKKKINKTYTF
jgi:hypothetical protein